MTAENMETPVDNTDDLDAFEADFFNTPAPKEAPSDDDKPVEDEAEEAEEKEPEADDDPVEEDDSKEEAEEAKPKKKSAQERISELTAARKSAEQRAEELEKQLAALSKKDTPKDTPQPEKAEPSPDETLEGGEPKYPLGEFDPQYIKDLTKFTLTQERDALRAEEQKERAKAEAETVKTQLMDDWNSRISEAETELPDFRTKAASLEDTFSDLDPSYGEYLATTIMALDSGPEVLYYLANNIEEAKKIAGMGPVRATIELGKIEGALTKDAPKIRQSEAPTPPPRNRGGTVTTRTRGDTDDLDAFEKEFYKKR